MVQSVNRHHPLSMQTATFVFVLVLVAGAIARPKQGDCGVKKASFDKYFESKKTEKVSIICQICEDLVEVAEEYAHCEEAVVEQKLDEYCDKWTHKNPLLDDICRGFVHSIMQSVSGETDQPPEAVCHAIGHLC